MIWIIGVWISLLLGLGLITCGLFWDRPGFRGRPTRRCRRCAYDLSDAGEAPVKCTECGRVHGTERSLRRVRRHKRVVAAGVVVLLMPAAVFLPAGSHYQYLPSWILADLMTVHGTDYQSMNTSPGAILSERLMDPQKMPPRDEVVGIINTIARGNFYAPPGSHRWSENSGMWIGGQAFRLRAPGGGWQYPDGTPGDEALNEAFQQIEQILPPWDPSTRAAWPAGSRVKIESGFQRPSWPVEGRLNERAELRIAGREPIVVNGFISHFEIEPIGEAGERIEATLELSMYRGRGADEQPARKESFDLTWDVVGSVDDVLETTDSAEIRTAIVELVAPNLARTLDDTGFLDAWLAPQFDGIAFGIEAEVFDGEESLGRSRHWWMAVDGQWVTSMTSTPGLSMDQYNAFGYRSNQARDRGTLRVVIRGVPELALRIHEAETAWDGEVDVLYSDAVKAAEAAQEETPPETTGP